LPQSLKNIARRLTALRLTFIVEPALMQLISEGRIRTSHLITHRYPLSRIGEDYTLFADKADNVIKTAIHPD
ncbi:MAG: hypothetical protein K2G06_06705, partial [Muribaculaceae bacterium]|nr:hypothetical protein [Muribaculaceae bacterium]